MKEENEYRMETPEEAVKRYGRMLGDPNDDWGEIVQVVCKMRVNV